MEKKIEFIYRNIYILFNYDINFIIYNSKLKKNNKFKIKKTYFFHYYS